MIDKDENLTLRSMLDYDEVKKELFNLNIDRSFGPDRLTSKFYQSCRDIVDSDIVRMMHIFSLVILFPNLSPTLTWSSFLRKLMYKLSQL